MENFWIFRSIFIDIYVWSSQYYFFSSCSHPNNKLYDFQCSLFLEIKLLLNLTEWYVKNLMKGIRSSNFLSYLLIPHYAGEKFNSYPTLALLFMIEKYS